MCEFFISRTQSEARKMRQKILTHIKEALSFDSLGPISSCHFFNSHLYIYIYKTMQPNDWAN